MCVSKVSLCCPWLHGSMPVWSVKREDADREKCVAGTWRYFRSFSKMNHTVIRVLTLKVIYSAKYCLFTCALESLPEFCIVISIPSFICFFLYSFLPFFFVLFSCRLFFFLFFQPKFQWLTYFQSDYRRRTTSSKEYIYGNTQELRRKHSVSIMILKYRRFQIR